MAKKEKEPETVAAPEVKQPAEPPAPASLYAQETAHAKSLTDKAEKKKSEDKLLKNRDYYRPCVFVDQHGKEYEAKIIPLPTNKGELKQIPKILPNKVNDEMQKIQRLPIDDQVVALEKLHVEMRASRPVLRINNEIRPLIQHGDLLCNETDFHGTQVPCMDLLVNVNSGKEGKEPDWRYAARVIPFDFVGTPRAGGRGRPHFKLA